MSKRRSNAPWIILGVVVAGGLAWFLLRPRAAPVARPLPPMPVGGGMMMPPLPPMPVGGGMMMPPMMPPMMPWVQDGQWILEGANGRVTPQPPGPQPVRVRQIGPLAYILRHRPIQDVYGPHPVYGPQQIVLPTPIRHRFIGEPAMVEPAVAAGHAMNIPFRMPVGDIDVGPVGERLYAERLAKVRAKVAQRREARLAAQAAAAQAAATRAAQAAWAAAPGGGGMVVRDPGHF